MLRRVALVRTDISEERSAPIIRVTRIGVLETTLAVLITTKLLDFVHRPTLAVTSNRRTLRRKTNVGAKSLGNVGSYKSHTA
jgi:hypothetical protein